MLYVQVQAISDFRDFLLTTEIIMELCSRILVIVQYVSNILAVTCNCAIHLYIVIRLLANYYKLSHYRNFVVTQSMVYIVDSTTKLLRNDVGPLAPPVPPLILQPLDILQWIHVWATISIISDRGN